MARLLPRLRFGLVLPCRSRQTRNFKICVRGSATSYDLYQVERRGFEPLSGSSCDGNDLGKSAFQGGAESGALSCENVPNGDLDDAKLADVVASWGRLETDQKRRILDIVAETESV